MSVPPRETILSITMVAMATIRLAFLNVQAAEDALPRIVEIMATQLKWSKAEKKVAICVCLGQAWAYSYFTTCTYTYLSTFQCTCVCT